MVAHQLRPRGINDPRVLAAVGAVARHRFAPAGLSPVQVYADAKLRLGSLAGQWLEEPIVAARLLGLLEVGAGMRVLEVGTGSGYTAALLAELGAQVFTVETDAQLAHAAEVRLRDLASRRSVPLIDAQEQPVAVRWAHRCGRRGWAGQEPFDRILLGGAVAQLPAELADQLVPRGFVIAPLGRPHTQRLVRARANATADGGWDIEPLASCGFEMLR